MTIERTPHPLFAGIWLVWFAAVVYALARPDAPVIGLWVLLAFLPIEAAGVLNETKHRDTLSEITTYVFRRLSKHTKPGRGWNALLLIVVLFEAWLLGRTVAHYSGFAELGILVGGLTILWLHDHLLRPDLHG